MHNNLQYHVTNFAKSILWLTVATVELETKLSAAEEADVIGTSFAERHRTLAAFVSFF
jgi:hypothetical protein